MNIWKLEYFLTLIESLENQDGLLAQVQAEQKQVGQKQAVLMLELVAGLAAWSAPADPHEEQSAPKE